MCALYYDALWKKYSEECMCSATVCKENVKHVYVNVYTYNF